MYEEGNVPSSMDVLIQETDLNEHHLIIPLHCALLSIGQLNKLDFFKINLKKKNAFWEHACYCPSANVYSVPGTTLQLVQIAVFMDP